MKWVLLAPFRVVTRLLLFLAAVAAILEADDGEAEAGRKRWLGRHHPTSHLPRHNR